MTERWSDEEVDLGLRALFAEARHPAAPSTLRMHARTVVAGGPRPRRFGLAAGPRVRGLVAVMATLALALAVTSAVLIVRPGSRVASQASPSPSPSATAPNALPAGVTGGGFVWTRLSLPTEPWKFGWRFFKAGGLTFGADCFASVPGEIWTSTNDLSWTPAGILPGAEKGGTICPSDVIWDGSRYIVSGGISHASAPDVLLPALWTSADATTWYQIALPASLPQMLVGNIAFGHGAYVAEVGDEFWSSPDLAHWSKVQALPAGYSLVQFDGSAFVAADEDPTGNSFTYSSNDGLTWTRADLGGSILTLVARPSSFVAIVHKSDAVVAMGSANGRTWTQLGALPAVIVDSCNRGMLLCDTPGSPYGRWLYSTDGLSWQDVPWPAGLPSGNWEEGPCPDPIFIGVMNGSGPSADGAVYVVQPQP